MGGRKRGRQKWRRWICQAAPCQSPLLLLLATIKALTVGLGGRGPQAPLTLIHFQRHSVNILSSLKCFQKSLSTHTSSSHLMCGLFECFTLKYKGKILMKCFQLELHVCSPVFIQACKPAGTPLSADSLSESRTMRLMADRISELDDYSHLGVCACHMFVWPTA